MPGSHFGASTAVVPGFGHTVYIALTALVINLVVAVVLTALFRVVRVPAGHDETTADNYLAEDEGAPLPTTPVGATATEVR